MARKTARQPLSRAVRRALPNQSFERTGHGRHGSLRSVSVIVARRSTQIR
jgi:hypothetical protein